MHRYLPSLCAKVKGTYDILWTDGGCSAIERTLGNGTSLNGSQLQLSGVKIDVVQQCTNGAFTVDRYNFTVSDDGRTLTGTTAPDGVAMTLTLTKYIAFAMDAAAKGLSQEVLAEADNACFTGEWAMAGYATSFMYLSRHVVSGFQRKTLSGGVAPPTTSSTPISTSLIFSNKPLECRPVITAVAASGRAITVLDHLPNLGDKVFEDRAYTIKTLGDYAEDEDFYYVRASNWDKLQPANEVMWTFTTPVAVTVYIDLWLGNGHLATPVVDWLHAEGSGWVLHKNYTGIGMDEETSQSLVYSQTFASGTVKIRGQTSGAVDYDSAGVFVVFIKPHVCEYVLAPQGADACPRNTQPVRQQDCNTAAQYLTRRGPPGANVRRTRRYNTSGLLSLSLA